MNYHHFKQSCRCPKKVAIKLRHWALLILATGVIATSPGSRAVAEDSTAAAHATACFDIVRPLANTAAGAILLNRCTGQTWVMVRTRLRRGQRLAYRWLPIERETTKVAANPPALIAPRVHLPAGPNSNRCFTFQGRRFCE